MQVSTSMVYLLTVPIRIKTHEAWPCSFSSEKCLIPSHSIECGEGVSICSVKGCEKTVRKRKKEKRDETFDSDDRRAPKTPLERPHHGRWMTKYAIWARVSVTIPFFVFLFLFFSVNLKCRNLTWSVFYWNRKSFSRDMWYVMGSKIRIVTNWRKSQGVYASLRETTR